MSNSGANGPEDGGVQDGAPLVGSSGGRAPLSRRSLLRRAAAGALALQVPAVVRAARAAAHGDPDELEPPDPAATARSTQPQPTSSDPASVGEWTAPVTAPVDVIPIHAILLHTGKVLFLQDQTAYLWNPVDGTGVSVDVEEHLFCSGHTFLPNGDVAFFGGAVLGVLGAGPPYVVTFSAAMETWQRQPDMAQGRYYPTTTTLPTGQVLVTSGRTEDPSVFNEDVELFTSPSTTTVVGSQRIDLYPHQQVLPDGTVIAFGPEKDTFLVDPSTWTWTALPRALQGRTKASGALLPGGPTGSWKVMMFGGKGALPRDTTEMFDAANPGAGWTYRAPIPEPREDMNAVLLPDGKILGVGGEASGEATLQTLMYDPGADTWTPLASQVERRGYHAIALLLPDGRVVSSGDTATSGGRSLIEIYSPPYLFQGPRPTITSAPGAVSPGKKFTIQTPSAVARVVLLRPGSVTHSNNMSQRHVELTFLPRAGRVIAMTPPNFNVAQPGYYLLFVLDSAGVPSVGRWLKLQ